VAGVWLCNPVGRLLRLRMAPRSMRPDPWQVLVPVGTVWAVCLRTALTWLGVAEGNLEMITAAAPETTAAAWLVPEPLKNRLETTAEG